MDKINEMIQKIVEFREIPYYTKHFQRLINILSDKEQRHRQENLNIAEYAELQVILEGICYYYQAIMENGILKNAQLKNVCRKLIESTSRAIYGLWSKMDGICADVYSKYLPAYREYLQGVSNAFRNEQISRGLDAPSLIFTFALELLGNKVHMDSLFTPIYEIENPKQRTLLCKVFVPADESVGDVFRYLPMLTHEVSHNFKYSETADRNNFIVKYMMDKISCHMVRRMLMQVADGKCDMFIGRAEMILSGALSEALKAELIRVEPKYIEKGHLDYLPSLIFSILNSVLEVDEDTAEYYSKEQSKYDILHKSFISLSGQSTLNWYLTIEENTGSRSDNAVIASFIMDILLSERFEEVEAYQSVSVCNDTYNQKMKEILETYKHGKLILDSDLMVIAAEEILLSVIEKMCIDFKEYSAKYNLSIDVLLELVCNETVFQKCLDKLISSTEKGDEQLMYEFVDRCISIRNCMNNIYYISRSGDMFAAKKTRQFDMVVRIYEALNDAVRESLSCPGDKPYFASRDIHALLINLGLLNGRNKSEVFVENYKKMLNDWGKQRIYAALEDYLIVYREIFADLSMCAVFRFNQLGYLRYMTDQFSNVREMGGQLSSNMTLERVQIVLRTIEHEHSKDEFINLYNKDANLGIEWTKEWADIIRTYINGDRRDEYDNRYYEVYTDKIVSSEWVKRLHEDDTVNVIGEYYNSPIPLGIEKEKVSGAFFEKYMKLSDMRQRCYAGNEQTPIEAMLEVNRNENT